MSLRSICLLSMNRAYLYYIIMPIEFRGAAQNCVLHGAPERTPSTLRRSYHGALSAELSLPIFPSHAPSTENRS
jgi:hypothetical protein